MKTTADALVIWENRTGEADRVLTLLTDNGVATAYARSSLKPGGKLTAATAMLSFANFELSSGKNMYNVDDASVNRKFVRLYADAESYALAVYFCELLRLLAPVEEDARDYMRLMLNSLYLLDGGSKPRWQVKAVFELTVMTLAGYMPDLAACSGCGKEDEDAVFFDALSAGWLCGDCARKAHHILNAPFTAVAAMRYIVSCEPKRAFAFSLSEGAQEAFCRCCEEFVLPHIEHALPTLDFYHTITT